MGTFVKGMVERRGLCVLARSDGFEVETRYLKNVFKIERKYNSEVKENVFRQC